jgi:hypothetical protein
VFKKFILGSLLVAGLTACPIVEPPIDPKPVSPTAINDSANTNPSTSATIKPADNDKKGDGDLLVSSIDLDTGKDGQQTSVNDSTGKGTFKLTSSSGIVTFTPVAGKTGDAKTSYTIKDTNGNISSPATITVTIGVIPTGPIQILFIGNSRTDSTCDGALNQYQIPKTLESLAVNEPRKIITKTVRMCSQTLTGHYNSGTGPGTARGEILNGTKWNFVVLQEYSNVPVASGTAAEFDAIVKKFNDDIKSIGARTLLYENWVISSDPNYTQENLSSAYRIVADKYTNMGIVPVGTAWKAFGGSAAGLYFDDRHASSIGAYLTAAMFYAHIYQKTNFNNLPLLDQTSANALKAQQVAGTTYFNLNSKYR